MNKLKVIIQREYLSRVKRRSFLLTTLLVPIIIIAFYVLMGWLITSETGDTKRIAVIDQSGYFKNKLANSRSILFAYPNEDLETVKGQMDDAGYAGILYIPSLDVFKVNDNIKYYSNERLGPGPKEYIMSQLRKRIRSLRMKDLNIDNKLLDSLEVDMTLPEYSLNDKSEGGQTASEILSLIGYVIGFMLYFVLIIFGTMVMRGVKEEKTNRIVEVIISSVKPFQLMLGKIIGISLVGLTQFLIWGVIFYLGYAIAMPILVSKLNIDPAMMQTGSSGMPPQDLDTIQKLIVDLANYNYTPLAIAFIFYFIGGYFVYASLFSAVGSIIEDDNESQQFVLPVMMPIILSIGILTTIMNDPNNPLAVWSSIFPLTSPIIMPARIPFEPPTWQIVTSALFLILGSFFFVWLSAKIYRIGILMYGKRITFKEILKWFKY